MLACLTEVFVAWAGKHTRRAKTPSKKLIRTAVIKDQRLYIQAGAGIVADSVPASEWEETMNKGRAIFRAGAKAEAGLEQPPQK